MKTEEIIQEIAETNNLSKETIKQIEESKELRIDLVNYFDKHKNRDFALGLLRILSELRRDPDVGLSGDSLMLACYLLGKHQKIEDCLIVWQTKQINFDTFSYLDIQLIAFAGIKPTIEYLNTQSSKEAKQALEYIVKCADAGEFEKLDEYYARTPWFV